MRTFDINEVLERFDDLIEEVANGDPFNITVNGLPKARFEPINAIDSDDPERADQAVD